MKKLLSLLLALALLLSLAACGPEPQPTQPTTLPTIPPTTQPAPTGEELYANAVAQLQARENLTLEIALSKETTVGGETFREASDQTLALRGIGGESLCASLTETLKYDGYTKTITEQYLDGTMYGAVEDYLYRCALPQDVYLSRFVPAILLDSSLYGSVTTIGGPGFLSFSQPTGLESWAAPEFAQLESASGTLRLDEDGCPSEGTYHTVYTQGPARIKLDVTLSVLREEAPEVLLPEDPESYVLLETPEAPRVLIQAYGFVLQGSSVSSGYTQSIFSQAAGVVVNHQNRIDIMGEGSSLLSKITSNVYVMDYNQNESVDITQEELFRDGVYTISRDGGEPKPNRGIRSGDIQAYCDQFLSATIPLPGELATATLTDLGSLYLLEYTYNEEAAKSFCDTACGNLFNDPSLLNNLASDYRTEEASGYFALDKYTGLPTAMGILYGGYHTIEGDDYYLSFQEDQSFTLASQSVYESVMDEPMAEPEPEEKARPLFYHVEGEDGQEMWLLGTIHIGDARTAYLPQEIYNAFEKSVALAVEFDTDAFEEQAETDDALQEMLSETYFYSDGTTAADHIADGELYAAALQLLKATGNFNMNAEYMKPSLWSQSIENFYLDQGYGLTSARGMDSRLLKLARDQGKPIRNVESAELQIRMITGYSDPLQELLLGGTVSTDALEYIASTQELYEQWCQGNEDTLRETLKDDLSDMTQEERTLYEEYNQAMMTDRNAGMLAVAREYLESGDCVFYAVGLAHLLSDDGLVNTLREAGYTVTPVEYK